MKTTDIARDISELKGYLLNSHVGRGIAKIYLFGSYAKGEATKHSDVDILIVTLDGPGIEKAVLDAIFDFQLDSSMPIEVMVSSASDLFPVREFFLANVMRHGVEVYSMNEADVKREAVRSMLDLADEYLESAQDIMQRERLRVAIDAAYNAAELAAKGLILLKQDDVPGSHGGVVSAFGQLYVNTGEISKDVGRALSSCLKLRNDARYRASASLTKENTNESLNLARTLLELAREKLRQ